MRHDHSEIFDIVKAANELLDKHNINEQLVCEDEDLRYFTLTAVNKSSQDKERLFQELTRNQAFKWMEGFMTALLNKRFSD